MTDEEIRGLIKWQYDRGRATPSPMAEIIFRICCEVRDRINRPESEKIKFLKEKIFWHERYAKIIRERMEKWEDKKWRERYDRLYKIHRRDVELRQQARRYKLPNFSIRELQEELQKRKDGRGSDRPKEVGCYAFEGRFRDAPDNWHSRFRKVLEVRWSKEGEIVVTQDPLPNRQEKPLLCFVSWNAVVYSVDTLIGRWTRLYLPWEIEFPSQDFNSLGEKIEDTGE